MGPHSSLLTTGLGLADSWRASGGGECFLPGPGATLCPPCPLLCPTLKETHLGLATPPPHLPVPPCRGTSCFRPRCARASGSTQRRASVLKRRKEKGTQSPKVRGCLDALWGHDGTGRSPEQRGLSGKAARWKHPCRRYSLFPTRIETRSPTQKKTLRAKGPKAQRDSSSRLCFARHKRDPQHV